MCLKSIRIVNKSDRIAAVGGKPILFVPCGQCDECLDAKRKSYYVRTFAEYQDLEPFINQGKALVYFDTLTYSNKYLPKWHGIKVFNHRHIQLFLKRLRKNLSSAGYDVNDSLRYFICSEYGDKTQRPHYHVLFFLRFFIDVEDFWRFVRKSWIYGFNDRLKQKIINGKVCKGAKERVVDGNGALRYVSGYTVKDKSYMKIFNDKVAELVASGYDIDDSVLRSLQPRFFLSRGFGLSFIEDQSAKYHFNKEYYEKTGKITISDFKYLKQDFALPEYFRRKVYFVLEKTRLEGQGFDPKTGKLVDLYKYTWKPNQLYIDYLINNCNQIIENATSTLYNSFISLPDDYDGLLGKSVRQYVTERLGSRSFRDLAIYQQFYCNRIGCSSLLYLCPYNRVHSLFNGSFVRIDHSSKYSENTSIDELAPYIISDRSSRYFEHFDEILKILDGFNLKQRKNLMAFVRSLREERKKTRYRSHNFY